MIDDDDTIEIDETDDIDNDTESEGVDDLKITGVQFAVKYLLTEPDFAEWFFCRNRWDEVEQQYDTARKKLAEVSPQPIRVDLAASRVKSKSKKKSIDVIYKIVLENPGISASEISKKMGDERVSSIHGLLSRYNELFDFETVTAGRQGGYYRSFYVRGAIRK